MSNTKAYVIDKYLQKLLMVTQEFLPEIRSLYDDHDSIELLMNIPCNYLFNIIDHICNSSNLEIESLFDEIMLKMSLAKTKLIEHRKKRITSNGRIQ